MAAPYYESDERLAEYLLYHYGTAEEQLPWVFGPREALFFPQRCVEEGLEPAQIPLGARALDLGCGVGAATFALSVHCASVLGLDASTAFIRVATQLAKQGHTTCAGAEGQGEQSFRVPANSRRERVRFAVGDAQDLPGELGAFDVVLACNLLCRLPEPQRLLHRLPSLVAPGGRLLITTPYSWLETFTPRENWLPQAEGGIARALEPHFELEARQDLPFLIREHPRKFQWCVAEATRWRRRA